jgi:hypothetical protein
LILSIVVNFLFECFLGWETKIPTRLRGGNYKKIMDDWETKIPTRLRGGNYKKIMDDWETKIPTVSGGD